MRAEGKGGFLILEYQKSFSPPCLQPSLIDQINIDLTPIIYSVFYELKISIYLLFKELIRASIYPNYFSELAHASHKSKNHERNSSHCSS